MQIKWRVSINTGMEWINYFQKKPARGVLKKRCSENMQQLYRTAPMPKCDFNKVAKQLHWNQTLAWVFSCKFAAYFQNTFFKNLLHIFRTLFLKNTSGRLLLYFLDILLRFQTTVLLHSEALVFPCHSIRKRTNWHSKY